MQAQINNSFAIPGIASKRKRSFKEILSAVCEHYSISTATLLNKSRKKPYVFYKQVFHYLLRDLTNMTLENIGKETDYDHTNVYYGYRKVSEWIEIYPSVKNDVELLKQKLG